MDAASTYSNGVTLVTGLLVVTVILAAVLTRSFTSPISDTLAVAERIAGSDLSQEVGISGRDEAGRLLDAWRRCRTTCGKPSPVSPTHPPNWRRPLKK